LAAPAAWALDQPGRPGPAGPPQGKIQAYDPRQAALAGRSTDPSVLVPTGGSAGPDGADLTLNTADPTWGGDLGAYLGRGVRNHSRHLKVRVVGTGSHPFTPIQLPDGMVLEIRVEPSPGAEPPSWYPRPGVTAPALIELHGGALVLAGVILHPHPDAKLDTLLALHEAHLVLVRCQLTVPPGTAESGADLIRFLAPSTRPIEVPAGGSIFRERVDRPVCRLIDSILIGSRTALRADLGRGLVALSNCAVASDETAIELNPAGARVARDRFAADLWLERSTLMAGHSIVALGRWPALGTGPYRPWVVNSRRSAFLTLADTRPREAVFVRVDADAFAGGCLFWQADSDGFELDHVAAAGESVLPASRTRDLPNQWAQFWGSNRRSAISAPRSTVHRQHDRLRPGSIEPADLLLEMTVRGPGGSIAVGADLARLGVRPRAVRPNAPRR
ncbi:MAG: hypothetical protein ACYC61_20920, partial [Isosphaeraceae bacterium]